MKEGWEKRKGKRKGKGEDMPNWAPEQSEQPEQFLVTPKTIAFRNRTGYLTGHRSNSRTAI